MKKINKTIAAFAIAAACIFSQSNVQAQAMEQGKIGIDIYYGYSAFGSLVAKSISKDPTTKISFTGPVGLRGEYMVADEIGVGLDFNFTKYAIKYPDGNGYTNTLSRSVIRIMPQFVYHFGDSDKFDGFFRVAAGYRTASYKETSTDPAYTGSSIAGLNPFAMRLAVGGAYYFTDNIGINLEIGLAGGGAVQGGLSIKL